MYNNSFSYNEEFTKAQDLADGILNQKISNSFDGLIKQINVHLPKIEKYLVIHTIGVLINVNLQHILILKIEKI